MKCCDGWSNTSTPVRPPSTALRNVIITSATNTDDVIAIERCGFSQRVFNPGRKAAEAARKSSVRALLTGATFFDAQRVKNALPMRQAGSQKMITASPALATRPIPTKRAFKKIRNPNVEAPNKFEKGRKPEI